MKQNRKNGAPEEKDEIKIDLAGLGCRTYHIYGSSKNPSPNQYVGGPPATIFIV
jgi:hypothetical protein